MIRTALVAAVVAAVVAGGWGCTQSPGGLSAVGRTPAARLAEMEKQLAELTTAQAKLAEESAAVAARLTAEQEKAAGLVRERDELRTGLGTRTTERDAVRAKFDGFHRELKELLTRVEGGAPTPSPAALGSVGMLLPSTPR